MDKIPLVIEFIEAGSEFIAEFDKHYPVRAAFWLREPEITRPTLFVASEGISGSTQREANLLSWKIISVLGDPNFENFQVYVIGLDSALAKAAMEVLNRGRLKRAARFFSMSFGNVYADEVYIYPPAAYQSHAAVS